jgi:hypothetical protein
MLTKQRSSAVKNFVVIAIVLSACASQSDNPVDQMMGSAAPATCSNYPGVEFYSAQCAAYSSAIKVCELANDCGEFGSDAATAYQMQEQCVTTVAAQICADSDCTGAYTPAQWTTLGGCELAQEKLACGSGLLTPCSL